MPQQSAHLTISLQSEVVLVSQASKARLEAAVQQSMQQDVRCWEPAEVCDWCDFIGLGQYRKKFVHHCIDGSLLLRLNDRDLKVRIHMTAAAQATHCICEVCS